MKIAFNPSTVAALITPPNNKDITFDLRGRNIFARGVKFCGTDTWRDIKINNVSIGSNILDLRNGSNTTLTNTNGVVTINSTWRPVVDNLTSDSTTSSLSAKQGKILKSLIDGKSNSGHTHDDRYLKLTGGTMAGNALITFADSGSWGTDKGPQGARGGLYWTGQSDYAKLYAEETVGDNLDLVIQFGDDNSNGLSIRNKANTQTSYISASGVITTGTFKGNLDWSYITNKPATATRWPSWAEVTGKPSSFTPSTHTHGLSNSVFFLNMPSISGNAKWKEVFGYPVNYNLLLSVRINNPAPEWCVGNFGSGILYGGSDTKGFMSSAYNEPLIMWAGGNGSSDDSVPKWYIGIKGIHKSIYNLATIASEANSAYNLRHSHANKSVLDGITSALVNNWNAAYTFVNTITGTDTDKVINKWDEIVNFLAGITEDNKLNTLLNSKLSVYELASNTNVGAIKNNGIYYSTTDASSGTLTNSPFNTGFALINMTSLDNGDDLRRSRLAFNAYGEIKISNDRGQANTAETWYNVLTSNNSGINGSTIKLNGTSITVYSSSTADGRYVKKSGDTMSGTLTIDTTNFGALTIKRNDDANGASIQFRGKSSVYGYIGLNNSTKDKQFLRWNSDTSKTYTILDTSSTYTSNGKGVINGTTITQVDNATNSTNSTNARKLVNWYSTRPTSLNAQFGDGSLRIFYATSSTTEGKPAEDSHILHLAWDNNGGWDAQLAVHTRSGKVSTRAQNSGTWQPWKTLAFTTDIPSSLKNPYSLTTFGVVYDGSSAKTVTTSTFVSQLSEGTSTVTDGTMLITSWASNSGFADTNAVNVPYKRKAIHLWEYIKTKTDSLYALTSHNHDGRYVRAFGTSNDNIDSDWGQSFKTFDPIPSGTPPEQNPNISILNIGNNFNRRKQLAFIYSNDNIYYRRHVDNSFTNWRRIAFANEIPTSLKNPYALTISLNGTSQGPYDGSAAKNINITPGSIGAATSNHTHPYLPLSGGTVTGNIILKGGTSADMTYAGNVHPYIRFDNSDSSQNVSLIFTDYDTYKRPAGIKLVGNQGNEWFEAANIYATTFYGALSGNASSANKLTTARNIALGTDLRGSANFDGSNNITISANINACTVQVGSTNGLPFKRIAHFETGSSWNDNALLLYISQGYINGSNGICRVEFRTDNISSSSTSVTASAAVRWLVRNGYGLDSLYAGYYVTTSKAYIDIYLKTTSSYQGTVIRVLQDSRGSINSNVQLINSYYYSDTNHKEAYNSIEAASTALYNRAYTRIVSGSDVGTVSYSNSTGSVHWNNVTNKPSTFAPAAHTHTVFKNNLMIKGTNGISDSASIHLGIGDSDTGFKWISDGKCQIYANNSAVGEWTSGGMNWFKNPTVNGNKVWNAGNDGSGSGLDADLLDGWHLDSIRKNVGYSWSAKYRINNWSRIIKIDNYSNILLAINFSQNSQASNHLYLISTGYGCGNIVQLGANGYNSNSAIKIRLTENTATSHNVEIYSTYGYNGATELSTNCNYTRIDGNSTITTYLTYTAGGGTVRKEITSSYSKIVANLQGNSDTTTKLQTPRQINGTNFDGSANITTSYWGTTRTLTIGNSGKSVNGSANISWSLSEIGAADVNHTHGLLHSNLTVTLANTTTDSGWSMINSSYNGFLLKSIRTQGSAPNWIENNYAAGICFGGADTKGVVSVAYGTPYIKFAGGNGSKPVWWIRLSGISGATYNLANFNAASATKLATARTIWGQSFDGTANISGTLSGVAHIQFSADNTYNIGSNGAASKYIYTYWLGAKSGQKLELGANNSGYGQGLCIDTNLNVGIGTNTPTYKLHVNGTFRATNSTVSDLFINTGDATLKIYTGITTDAQNDGNICFQTSIDATDGQSHAYPTQYQSRCNIVLQPRGGQVYIGTNPGTGNTTYKLYVNSKIFSNGGFVKNGSSDSYVLLGGGGHKAVSAFAPSSHSHNYAANENYGGFTKSGRLPISGFYQSNASESGGNAPWSGWMHLINCQHSNTGNNYALQIAASFSNNNTFKIRVTNNNVNNAWRDIIHSGNIGSQSVAYASKAGSVAWDSITGKPSSFTPSAHTHSWTSITDKLVAGNEFNIVNAGFNNRMWFNYVPINDRSKTATILDYGFGNGHQGYATVTASGFVKNGSSSSYVLLGDGGHKTISSLSVNYANSAGNADTVDRYHANTIYNAPSFTVNNSNTSNTYILLATITISGTSLGCAEFTTLFQNRECLDSSSFILSGAIRRNSTTSVTATLSYITLHTKTPRNIYLRSNDGVTFLVYIQSAASAWTTYYRAIPIVDSGNITYSNTGTTSPISGSVLNITATKGGNVNYASSAGNADTLDSYHANGLLTALSNSNNGVSITIGGTTKSISNISVNHANSAGSANTATKLTSSAGNAALPIYFSDGKPVACTASSVFSNLSNSGNNLSITVAGQNRTLTVGYATSAGSTTKVIVNQHTTNDTNYPLVWSNQNNSNNATENQLYKSWSDLYYNPKNKRLTVGGSVVASSFIKSDGTSQQLLRADGGIATFNWSGQSGQPTWLWGGNNQHSYYVYNPSNFRVAYATSAGSADTLDGVHLSGIFTAFGNNGHNITATIGGTTKSFLVNWAADSDKLDGYHASDLLTSVTNTNNGISVTVGGTTKSVSNISVNYASNAGSVAWDNITGKPTIPNPTNYYWANVKISTSSSTTTSPTVSNLTATSSIRMGNIYLQNTNEINSTSGIHLNYQNSGNISLCVGGGNVGIGAISPAYKLNVNGDIHSSGTINCNALNVGSTLSIKDSVISCSASDISIESKESGSLLINSSEVLRYDSDFIHMSNKTSFVNRLGLGTGILGITYTTDDVTVLIGSLRESSFFEFRPAMDGQLLFLKIGKLYSNIQFYCTARNCEVIKANNFNTYLARNDKRDCFGDGSARIFIYKQITERWYEFYCG